MDYYLVFYDFFSCLQMQSRGSRGMNSAIQRYHVFIVNKRDMKLP
jgi:hypothetical protein